MNPSSNVLPRVPPFSAANKGPMPRPISARTLRQECTGKYTSRALALALDRLEELESLLEAYESGQILITHTSTSQSMQRDPADPIRELRGRVAAATDFIMNRFRDTPWSVLRVDPSQHLSRLAAVSGIEAGGR